MKKGTIWMVAVLILTVSVVFSQTNILVNGDLETLEPNFWTPIIQNVGSDYTGWADVGFESMHSLKVMKNQATAEAVGWVSDNNADLYWNNAGADLLYNLSFRAKTEGANTNPANDDAAIGVLFSFYGGGALLAEKWVPVDQTAASTDWTEYTDGLLVPAGVEPDEMIMKLLMGKDATGTVWFDNIGCGSDPWTMWPFNGDAETPVGWMNWADGTGGFANLDDTEAYEGTWSALLRETDDNGDEMVFYSEPVEVMPNSYYAISVWVKRDSGLTNAEWIPSNATGEFRDKRMNVCFFYHRDPMDKAWDLTGGDQFFYFDERDSSSDWMKFSVISKSPEDAAGVSVRARFNPLTKGYCWYDNFSVEPATILETAVEEIMANPASLPKYLELFQNYPNPFNPDTRIGFNIAERGRVELDVYNLLGQRIRRLVNEERPAGVYEVVWDGKNDLGQQVVTGVYIYHLKVNDQVTSKTMVLVK